MKNKLLLVYLLILSTLFLLGQNADQLQGKEVFKRFESKNTTKDLSILILYKDNIFVSYGTNAGSRTKEIEVWYTAGKWLANDRLIMCRTYSQKEETQILDEIQKDLQQKLRHRSKELPYKFSKIEYLNYTFIKRSEGIKDKITGLNYLETN